MSTFYTLYLHIRTPSYTVCVAVNNVSLVPAIINECKSQPIYTMSPGLYVWFSLCVPAYLLSIFSC